MISTPLAISRHQLAFSLFFLFALLLGGVAGFWLLGEDRTLFDALWLTTNLLTTVGDAGVEYTPAEKTWAIWLMLTGIFAALYAGGNIVAIIVDGELRRLLGRRKLENKLKHLDHHHVICGFGRMGEALCAQLHKRGEPFVLIDHDSQLISAADELGYLHILGDAMSEPVLELAQIKSARGLAACLSNDADNVFVTLSARGLNPNLTIIARAEEHTTEPKLHRAGADRVICPSILSANRVAAMLTQPAIEELLDVTVGNGELEITKFKGSQLPGLLNRPLRDVAIPARTGLMVAVIARPDGSRRFNPPPDFASSPDDELIFIGPKGGSNQLLELFADAAS